MKFLLGISEWQWRFSGQIAFKYDLMAKTTTTFLQQYN